MGNKALPKGAFHFGYVCKTFPLTCEQNSEGENCFYTQSL